MTKTLYITVNGKTAIVSRRQGPIVGSNDDYRAVFTFSSEWAQVTDKMARFIFNGTSYDRDIEVNANGEYVAEVPRLQGGPGLVKIGVYSPSILTQRTTTTASVPVLPSVLDEESEISDDPVRGIPALTNRQISTIERLLRYAAYTKDATEEYYDFLNAFGLVVFSLNMTMITLDEGDTQTLTATFSHPIDVPAEIVWTSSDPTIATVQDGVVTAVGDGSCIITAVCGSYSQECRVQVGEAIVPDVPVEPGDNFKLIATFNANDLVRGQASSSYTPDNNPHSVYHYMWVSTKRLTYPSFISIAPGFEYRVEYEKSVGDRIDVGIDIYNELAMEYVAKNENIPSGNQKDLGWHSGNTNFTPDQSLKGYLPAGLRITFRKLDTDGVTVKDINVGDVTKVRIYKRGL